MIKILWIKKKVLSLQYETNKTIKDYGNNRIILNL